MTDQLTDAEVTAMAVWAADVPSTEAMLAAVRVAVAATERRYEQSEDARLAIHERTVADIARMVAAFDTPRDPGRVTAFVGDLRQILTRLRTEGA